MIKESDNVESSKCIKCGKNCHKRAAFCEKTLLWIYYRCDKLSVETVHVIENDTTYKRVDINVRSVLIEKRLQLRLKHMANVMMKRKMQAWTVDVQIVSWRMS